MDDQRLNKDEQGKHENQGSFKEDFLVFVRKFKIFTFICLGCTCVSGFFLFRDVKAGKKSGSIFSPDSNMKSASIRMNRPSTDTDDETDNQDNQVSANPDNNDSQIEESVSLEENNGQEQDQSEQTNGDVQQNEVDNMVDSENGDANADGDSGNGNGDGDSGEGHGGGNGGDDGTTLNDEKQKDASALEVTGNLSDSYCLGSTVSAKKELGKLTVVATLKSNGKKKTLDYGQYSASKIDTSKSGNKTLTISYGGKSKKVPYKVEQWYLTLKLENGKALTVKPNRNLKVYTQEHLKEARQRLGSSLGGYILGWSLKENGAAVSNPFTMTMAKQTLFPTELSREDYDISYITETDERILWNSKIISNGTVNILDDFEYMGTAGFGEGIAQQCTVLHIPASIKKDLVKREGGEVAETTAVAQLWNKLQRFDVDAGNKAYSSDKYGVLYNKDMTKLYSYPKGRLDTEYSTRTLVRTICYNAFWDADTLDSVKLSNVSKIESEAFYNCDNLKSITISSKSMPSVASDAFTGIPSDAVVSVPENLVETYQNSSVFSKYTIEAIQ